MRGLLLYVVTLISRCHAHLRRDIPAIGKADHEEHYRNNQSFDDDVRVDSKTEPPTMDVANVKANMTNVTGNHSSHRHRHRHMANTTNVTSMANVTSKHSSHRNRHRHVANTTNVADMTNVTSKHASHRHRHRHVVNTTNVTDMANVAHMKNVTNNVSSHKRRHRHRHNHTRVANTTNEANRGPPFFRGDIRGDANFNDKNENGTWDTAGSRPEYYGSVVTCAGKTFLLTRLDLGMPFNKGWQTRVRDLGDFSQNVAELPSRVLRYNTLSHNVAGVCVNGEVILVGGQFRAVRGEPHWKGVHISRTQPTSLAAFAQISRPTLLFPGNHKGCVESRKGFGSACEFDGRFSLIHFRGRFLLYARANVPSRFVQITHSDDLKEWSPFKLIDIEGAKPDKMKNELPTFLKAEHDISMYFLTAAVMEKDEWIAGYFPGVISRSSGEIVSEGVHITSSKDGFHWAKPRPVFEAGTLASDRDRRLGIQHTAFYMMHPVGIVGLGSNRLMTHQPKPLSHAFKISQEFRTGHLLEDMNQTLQLNVLGREYALLGAPAGDAVVYDLEAWNE